jgi:hypothetical protein
MKVEGCKVSRKVIIGINDLATKYPDVAKTWHPTLNGDLQPTDVTSKSGRKVWWQCSNNPNHEWQATVAGRSNGSGCPYCSSIKILPGYNDLATTDPELAKEWNYGKNDTLMPTDVSKGSNRKVWWICENGHEYMSAPHNRSKGKGCPYCSGNKIIVGLTDLESVNPKLAKQWHPTLNGSVKPSDVKAGSDKKVWWLCDQKHSYQATISSQNSGH